MQMVVLARSAIMIGIRENQDPIPIACITNIAWNFRPTVSTGPEQDWLKGCESTLVPRRRLGSLLFIRLSRPGNGRTVVCHDENNRARDFLCHDLSTAASENDRMIGASSSND